MFSFGKSIWKCICLFLLMNLLFHLCHYWKVKPKKYSGLEVQVLLSKPDERTITVQLESSPIILSLFLLFMLFKMLS